jgi:hypothetical protein
MPAAHIGSQRNHRQYCLAATNVYQINGNVFVRSGCG